MIPSEVVKTTKPNRRDGRRLVVHLSIWLMPTSNLGEMTPHLFKRPFNSTTILPALWSSMISNSPMYPCFSIANIFQSISQYIHANHGDEFFYPSSVRQS